MQVSPVSRSAAPLVSPSSKGFPSSRRRRRPKILIVSPELSESRFLARHGKTVPLVKAGGLADVTALLVDSLGEMGMNVHIALPHYRSLFQVGPQGVCRRLHLCQDREFYYRRSVYDGGTEPNLRASLAFQRDVIHYLLPRLRPDVVHCNDWMTGLIPAAARSMGIRAVFSIHNLHDTDATLNEIENRGIDAASFWKELYFHRFPSSYEETRNYNPASLLASGILAADHVNTVSPSFLAELAAGYHPTSRMVIDALNVKLRAGQAHGILNAIPQSYSPARDPHIVEQFTAETHITGKRANKRAIQQVLGLEIDEEAPILFWPSRLDPRQKGCQLLADCLYRTVSDYWALGMQVVMVADGPSASDFRNIVDFHGLAHRIAVHPFSEALSRLGYAASDFTLIPSAYEPCGLAQMVGLRYGSLPIAHATGGLRDTITPLNGSGTDGNGFLFETHDSGGLRWAIDQAMRFYLQTPDQRAPTLRRTMQAAELDFAPEAMISRYLKLYTSLAANFSTPT